MRRLGLFRHVFTAALAVALAWLLAGGSVPHQHDDATVSHLATACRVCKLQEQGSAALALPKLPPVPLACLVRSVSPARRAPVLRVAVERPTLRAPPTTS